MKKLLLLLLVPSMTLAEGLYPIDPRFTSQEELDEVGGMIYVDNPCGYANSDKPAIATVLCEHELRITAIEKQLESLEGKLVTKVDNANLTSKAYYNDAVAKINQVKKLLKKAKVKGFK